MLLLSLLLAASPLTSALSGYDNRLSLADLQRLSPDLENDLIALANNEGATANVRGRAIALLGNFTDANATATLLALSEHALAVWRVKADKALRHLAAPRGDLSAHFVAHLQDTDPFVRIEAVRALGLAARASLIERFRSETDPRVRDAIAATLAH